MAELLFCFPECLLVHVHTVFTGKMTCPVCSYIGVQCLCAPSVEICCLHWWKKLGYVSETWENHPVDLVIIAISDPDNGDRTWDTAVRKWTLFHLSKADSWKTPCLVPVVEILSMQHWDGLWSPGHTGVKIPERPRSVPVKEICDN